MLLAVALLLGGPLFFLGPPATPEPEVLRPVLTEAVEAVAPPPAAAAVAEPFKYLSRDERIARIPAESATEEYLFKAAQEFNIPKDVALALVGQESGGDASAVSNKGAQGLTQVMPDTGARIARDLHLTNYDLFDPATNTRFGMFYLREQWNREGSLERALRAYNAGPGAVDASVSYPETNGYVASILAGKELWFDIRANVPSTRVFISGVEVTQHIGQGNHFGNGFDNGTDLVPLDDADTVVRATFDGTVTALVDQPSLCGYGVVMESPSGRYRALFCHLAASSQRPVGAVLSYGDSIGEMGATGAATGPHTHYSVLVRGKDGNYTTFEPRSDG